MTYFHISMTVTCPSDWTLAKVRKWIERILPTDREKESVIIMQVEPGDTTTIDTTGREVKPA